MSKQRTAQEILDEFKATLDDIRAQLKKRDGHGADDIDALREILGMERKDEKPNEDKGGQNE